MHVFLQKMSADPLLPMEKQWETGEKQNKAQPNEQRVIFSFGLVAVLILLGCSVAALVGQYASNKSASLVTGYTTVPSTRRANCTYWAYDGGFWPPNEWPSAIGDCQCARGWGCHCTLEGCGHYEAYNEAFIANLWFHSILIAISTLLLLFLLFCFAFSRATQ